MNAMPARPYRLSVFGSRITLRHFLLVALVLALGVNFSRADVDAKSAAAPRPTSFAAPGLSFEPNAGQDAPTARYVGRGKGYLVRLESSRAVIEFQRRKQSKSAAEYSGPRPSLSMNFAGASEPKAIDGIAPLPGTNSYFPGSDPKAWVTNVPTYSRVNYREIYPGVDLSFYGKESRLEYDFVLRPGADSAPISFTLGGAQNLHIDEQGNLAATVGGEDFKLLKPVAYQTSTNASGKVAVDAGYRIDAASGNARIGFTLGSYDRSQPLVIDPVLTYGLYLSGVDLGGDSSNVEAMVADSLGNTYVAADLYDGSGYHVLKFDTTGKLLLNASVGSSDVSTTVSGIGIDGTGNIYVAGSANTGLPVTASAYQPAAPSYSSAFLTKIKADDSVILYSSYLGGSETLTVNGLAVDKTGNAYIYGHSSGTDFPTTAGSYKNQPITNYSTSFGFVAKINATLSGAASLVYSALLYNSDGGSGIAVDAAGSAYINTHASPGFPVTTGSYQFTGLEVGDPGTYVTKLTPDGSNLVYSAFLGPAYGYGLALDGANAAYITGQVTSAEYPTSSPTYQSNYAGGFLSKLSADGTQLLFSTFLSGPSGYIGTNVTPTNIAIEPGCSVFCSIYIAGTTVTTDFPSTNPIQTSPPSYYYQSYNGEYVLEPTAFLVELAGNGAVPFLSTYFGGITSQINSIAGLSVDAKGDIYFASNINGYDAPITVAAAEYSYGGYLAKISPANASLALAAPTYVDFGGNLTVGWSAFGGTTLRNLGSVPVTLTRPFAVSSNEFVESDTCGTTLPAGGACTVNVQLTPAASGVRSGTLTIKSNAPNSPTVVPLTGAAFDEPALTASSYSLSFANTVVNAVTAGQVITITNNGNTAQPIAPTGDIPDFKLVNSCPAQLAAKASCKMTVSFQPTQIGLLEEYIFIQETGFTTYYYNGYEYSYPNGIYLDLTGTGIPTTSGSGTPVLSAYILNFGSSVINTTAPVQYVTLTNSGTTPLVVQSVTASTTGQTSGSDFSASGAGPFELLPESSTTFEVFFTPTKAAAETGTLTITDSAPGAPQTVALSGIGTYTPPELIITPSNMTFPAQPVGDPSASQTFYISNFGNNTIIIDRAITTGDFEINEDGSNCEAATLGTCVLNVSFTPSAVGARTGTLKVIDTLGNPVTFNLAGTGVLATGALNVSQSSLTFPSQATGTLSSGQQLSLSNPGNSPVTVNSIVATGDFAIETDYRDYNGCIGVLASGGTCVFDVTFSPTKASGAETGSLTIKSTVGTQTVTLNGTATAATNALAVYGSTLNFSTVQKGTTVGSFGQDGVYLVNNGNEPVTFSAAPTIAGKSPTPNADFALSTYFDDCSQYFPGIGNSPQGLPPGGSCLLSAQFTPSLTSVENAILTIADSAGTQTVALTGTGSATAPTVTLDPPTVNYAPLPAKNSGGQYTTITLTNNGTADLTIASDAVTAGSADFSLPYYDDCASAVLSTGNSCTIYAVFNPSAVGLRTGTVTFTDSTAKTYLVSLAGYGLAAVDAATITPAVTTFAPLAVGDTLDGNASQSINVANTGNQAFKLGTITSTNISFVSTTKADFSLNYSYCGTGQYVYVNSSCQINLNFTPQSTGAKTGSVSVPITYTDGTTATLTATVQGTALTGANSATLLPGTTAFGEVTTATANSYDYSNGRTFTLTNAGNESFTINSFNTVNVANLDTGLRGDFLDSSSYNCQGVLAPGSACQVTVYFQPLTFGIRSGNISFQITYANGTKATLTSTFSGYGLNPTQLIQVDPLKSQFNSEVVGTMDTDNELAFTATNTGTGPVKMAAATVQTNFTITSDGCSNNVINPGNICTIYVAFSPLATTAPGLVEGYLTFVDNAVGGKQAVGLIGVALPANQTLALSQTSLSLGTFPIDTSSAPQVVYVVDRGPLNTGTTSPRIQINSVSVGGANPTDFVVAENCGGNIGFTIRGRAVCEIDVAFAPGKGALGARTATITLTPTNQPPLVLQVGGTANAAANVAALSPSPLAFAAQSIRTTSTAQTIRLTNLVTRAISIGRVVLTNTAEFTLASDKCSGTSVGPGTSCLVTVSFTPGSTGTRNGLVQITDDAGHQLVSATVSGSGVATSPSN